MYPFFTFIKQKLTRSVFLLRSWSPYILPLILTAANVTDIFLNSIHPTVFRIKFIIHFEFEMGCVLQRITLKHYRHTETMRHACMCTAWHNIRTIRSVQYNAVFAKYSMWCPLLECRIFQSYEVSQFVIFISVWYLIPLACTVWFWVVISPKLIPAPYL